MCVLSVHYTLFFLVLPVLLYLAGQDVMKRLRTTFDRCSSNNGLLPQATFLRDVFGDGVPPKLAEVHFDICIMLLMLQ